MLSPSEKDGSTNTDADARADHFNDPVSNPQTVIELGAEPE